MQVNRPRFHMQSRNSRKKMASSDVGAGSRESAAHTRVCAALDENTRQLLDLAEVIRRCYMENPSTDLENLTSELDWQLNDAKQLAQGLSKYPEVYRALSAARIRAHCLHVCRSIGDSLENLTALLMHADAPTTFPDGYFDRLRELAYAFRHLEYPLQSLDIMIRQKTKDWASQVYTGQIKQLEGLIFIRDYLEDVIGKQKMKDEWGKVSTFFLHDIYNAHARDDTEEEHYLRLLFWALNGVDSPPPEYLCPISLHIMQDPVVLCESEVTYERQNITTWMIEDEKKTCPVSQKQIQSVVLVENASLKTAITNWLREQSQNPECDGGSTIISSATGNTHRSQFHYESEIESWDGNASALYGFEASNPLNAVPLSERNLAKHESDSSPSRCLMIPEMPVTRRSGERASTNSGQTVRLQRHIMTKEVASQMFAAATAGSLDILKEIRGKSWDFAVLDDSGRSPLHLACMHGRQDVVEYLLDQNMSPNSPTKDDTSSPLILAALNGHPRCVEVLLDRGADLIAQDKRGWTALHVACDLGHRSVIESLVKFGELRHIRYLDIKTEIGWTVLHNAARKGDLDVFKFLLRFRCNINEPCKAGWTVLHIAVERGHKAIVKEILRQPSCNINACSKEGWTALHSAVESGDLEIGRLLIQHNINVDAAAKNGYSALHRAAYYNKIEFGKVLVEEGNADRTLKTKSGRTAKDITSEKGFNEFHQYLFRCGILNFIRGKKR